MRVAIIGAAGRVGSVVGYNLLGSAQEILLADILDSVEGEALDLQHTAKLLGCNTHIKWTLNNADCKGYDLIIITAGLSLATAKTGDRNALWQKNRRIIRSIMECLGESIYIVTTNPVDAIATVMSEYCGQVLGVSTLTDTSRLQGGGYLIGEHAGAMALIDGDEDISRAIANGRRVIAKKQGSWFATATAVAKVARAIIQDTKETIPVSVMLDGEYGIEGVCLSVPCVIGASGTEKILELDLTEEQKETLARAAANVRRLTQ